MAEIKIMVVEDHETLLSLLRRALEKEGYEVIGALNGVEMMKRDGGSDRRVELELGAEDAQ